MLFAEQIEPGQLVKQRLPEPAWMLDFAFDGPFEIDGRRLSAGFWGISQCNAKQRVIKAIGPGKGDFFSVGIHKNPYADLEIQAFQKKGLFTASMAYPVLKLISGILNNNNYKGSDKIKWTRTYINLLLIELSRDNTRKSPVSFGEFKAVYRTIEGLQEDSMNFPLPSVLVIKSGIKKFRFQRTCLTLYGQSCQKIIQHLKMKQAIELILNSSKSIDRISSEFGYDHSPNFITAFHKHYGVTPLEAIHFRGS